MKGFSKLRCCFGVLVRNVTSVPGLGLRFYDLCFVMGTADCLRLWLAVPVREVLVTASLFRPWVKDLDGGFSVGSTTHPLPGETAVAESLSTLQTTGA